MKKYISSLIMLAGFAATAQSTANAPIATFHGVLIGIIIVLAVIMLMVVYVLQQVVNLLKQEGMQTGKSAPVAEQTFWEKMLSLKPLSAEKDVELDHDFDGIRELNNPIPPWFNVLFYGTIVFAFAYLMVYHVFDLAPLQAKEYENQMAEAKVARDLFIKQSGSLVDENNVKLLTDASKVNAGKETYVAKCLVCHGDKLEGKVGPNLTDAYWLHGGTIQDIFKTIKYGVPAKGMIAWENSLNGSQIQELASYILSMQGTNPPGAKAPQGELAGAPAATATTSDTTVKQ